MEDDGSDDVTVVDGRTGEVVEKHEHDGGSRTQFIADALGLSKDEVNSAMAAAGWSWTKKDGWTNGRAGTDVSFSAAQADTIAKHIGMLFDPAPETTEVAERTGIFHTVGAAAKNAFGTAVSWLGDQAVGIAQVWNGMFEIHPNAAETISDSVALGDGDVEYFMTVGSPTTQDEFGKQYGFSPNWSCGTTSITYMLASLAGDIPTEVMDGVVAEARKDDNHWIDANGVYQDLPKLTEFALNQLGQSGYIDYVYQDGQRVLMTPEEFDASRYEYGLGDYFNDLTQTPHKTLFNPEGEFDPLPDRTRPQWEDYYLRGIYPLQWIGRD